MRKIMEFEIPLGGTPEEQKQAKETRQLLIISAPVALPAGAVIKRVGIRINEIEQTGVHPKTKQIGKFVIPTEMAYIWAECDPSAKAEIVNFKVVPTGFDVPEGMEYVGTFLMLGATLGFHLYR